MKRTVKPVVGQDLGTYWRSCDGRFLDKWYQNAMKYALKNGAILDTDKHGHVIVADVANGHGWKNWEVYNHD